MICPHLFISLALLQPLDDDRETCLHLSTNVIICRVRSLTRHFILDCKRPLAIALSYVIGIRFQFFARNNVMSKDFWCTVGFSYNVIGFWCLLFWKQKVDKAWTNLSEHFDQIFRFICYWFFVKDWLLLFLLLFYSFSDYITRLFVSINPESTKPVFMFYGYNSYFSSFHLSTVYSVWSVWMLWSSVSLSWWSVWLSLSSVWMLWWNEKDEWSDG